MFSEIHTMGINGIVGEMIYTECYVSNGLPGFEIVGLPDLAVKEARERVRAAAKNSGQTFPASRITVNLAPANLKKVGTHYDLPILMSILCATGNVLAPRVKSAFLGELGLNGEVRSVTGVLPMAIAAKNAGVQQIFVPADNAPEATLAGGPAIIPVKSVRQLCAALNGQTQIEPQPVWVPQPDPQEFLDFKDVVGQESAKRALEVAAAGGHNILFVGPPGSGKSMLSKRLPSIMPDMTREEALEVSRIYSVMGLMNAQSPLIRQRPFRSPHHTVSNAGIIGGGSNPRPGEITLAHKGVLFLDEVPEFQKNTLDMLRQPMEDARVTISRASGSVTYPAEFMLVCAMNPCKCGWYGDTSGRCTCSESSVRSYLSKISGPLLDRIDIMIEVPALKFEELRDRKDAEPSSEIKKRVDAARAVQNQRFQNSGMCNARMHSDQIKTHCKLDKDCMALIESAFSYYGLTARSYDRILKVSRTIADLDGSENIQYHHVAEALQHRLRGFAHAQ